MLLFHIVLMVLTISMKAFAPISPGEIDSGWLTLATGDNSQKSADEHRIGSPKQNLHTTQPTVEVAKEPATVVIKRNGQHLKTPEHIESIRAAWTPERRKRQAERARKQHLERGPEFKAKIQATWTEKRRREQAERSRKLKTGFVHSIETRAKMTKTRLGMKKSQATKDKIREAVRRSHALRKEAKPNAEQANVRQE